MSAKPSGRGRSVHLTFEIKRIGNDSDWAALSCAYNYCLALRGDGSLWGWGANGEILGKGPENPAAALAHFVWRGSYLTPKRIGNDSDWAAISAEGISAMAIKRDGSVWKWGLLQHPPEKPVNKHNPTLQYHAAPVRWTSAGTNWVILDGRDDRRMLALHNDGAMYAFAGLVGEPTLDWIGSDTEWQRVENGAAPSEFKMRGGQLVVQLSAALRYNLSKYSDWVTPGVLSYWHGGSVWRRDAGTTLAADGTLSHWKLDLGMLGPSRHPAWSINILDEKP